MSSFAGRRAYAPRGVYSRRAWTDAERFLHGDAGRAVVGEHIKPRHIIAVHVSPSEAGEVAAQIRQVFPEAVAFTTMLEKGHY